MLDAGPVGNRFSNQAQAVTIRKCRRSCSEHPDFRKNVKVLQVQVIDEVAKVSRSMRRQDPMTHEMQKDQKREEVQISFKVSADHAKDRQHDTPELQAEV